MYLDKITTLIFGTEGVVYMEILLKSTNKELTINWVTLIVV